MAIPNTKATLKEYCLRALGKPVIDVNVDVAVILMMLLSAGLKRL